MLRMSTVLGFITVLNIGTVSGYCYIVTVSV